MFLLKKAITALILPPVGPVLLAFLGLWLARTGNASPNAKRRRRVGLWLAGLSLFSLLALSMPLVSSTLTAPLQSLPPITPAQLGQVQAIIILGGGTYSNAPEYGSDNVGAATLERLRYGAKLAKESGLPLLLSGGAPHGGRAESETMREVLEQDFGVKAHWTETKSRDTLENAHFSAEILKGAGIRRIALVSHASHLPRAIPLFEREGFTVIAAPTGFRPIPDTPFEKMLPGGALGASRAALHEYLGQLYNFFRESI